MPKVASLIQPCQNGPSQEKLNDLTPKQRIFISEMLADREFNAGKAAAKAGYNSPTQSAYQLLQNKTVVRHLGKKLREMAYELKLDASRVLEELMTIGFNVGPKALVDKRGSLIPLHELPDEISAAISSIVIDQIEDSDGNVKTSYKVKWWNKNEALELLGKHLALFDDRLHVDHDVSSLKGAIAFALDRIEDRSKKDGGSGEIPDAVVIDPTKIEDKLLE